MSIMLAKKINKIINEKNNSELKKQREEKYQEELKRQKNKKREKYLAKIRRDEKRKEDNEKRKILTQQLEEKIKNFLFSKIDGKIIKKVFDKKKKQTNSNRKTLNNFKIFLKNKFYTDIKNNYLTRTHKYKFANKELYVITADAYAFTGNYINKIIEKININNKIKTICGKYFDGG